MSKIINRNMCLGVASLIFGALAVTDPASAQAPIEPSAPAGPAGAAAPGPAVAPGPGVGPAVPPGSALPPQGPSTQSPSLEPVTPGADDPRAVVSTPDPTPPAVGEPLARLADAAPATKTEEAATVVKAGKDGFSLASEDNKFVLKLRGYAQADARIFLDDVDEPPPHVFLLRRVRPIFEGTLYEYFGFRVMPDFGGGQTVLQDAHIDVRPLKEISFRVGKFKTPFGLERLQSATNLLLIERAFPTQLAPNRDIGAQLYGEVADGTFNYALGVFNGVPDGGSADTDLDKHKDLVARVFAHPLRPTGVDALKDLGVGVAVSTGTAEGVITGTSVAQYRSSGQQAFFRYRAVEGELAETAVADGRRNRISPQLYYYYGPFGLLGEYVLSAQRVAVGEASRLVENRGWQASATVAIGGKVSYEGVKPDSSVADGGIGAFEISARYHGLRVDEEAFPIYADPARAARSADGLGLGVGWWANRAARFVANYETTSYEGGAADGADRPTEKLVLLRSQISW